MTPLWEHDIDLRISHKSEDGDTTTNRYFATYSIVRNLAPRYYVGAVLWAERDPFAGYDYRFSEGVGLGYRLIQKTDFTLVLEGGAALRQSEFLDRGYEATTAARMAGYVTWKVRPQLIFKQDLVAYVDRENNTILSTTSLTSRQWGNIASRLSYEVRHEQKPPAGRESTDTTSRVSLVFTH